MAGTKERSGGARKGAGAKKGNINYLGKAYIEENLYKAKWKNQYSSGEYWAIKGSRKRFKSKREVVKELRRKEHKLNKQSGKLSSGYYDKGSNYGSGSYMDFAESLINRILPANIVNAMEKYIGDMYEIAVLLNSGYAKQYATGTLSSDQLLYNIANELSNSNPVWNVITDYLSGSSSSTVITKLEEGLYEEGNERENALFDKYFNNSVNISDSQSIFSNTASLNVDNVENKSPMNRKEQKDFFRKNSKNINLKKYNR